MTKVAITLSQGGAMKRAAILHKRTGQDYEVVPAGQNRWAVVLDFGRPVFPTRPKSERFTERDFAACATKRQRTRVGY